MLAKSQTSLATCCSHWHSTCVTCNLCACLCPMCPHSSVPLDCATLVTRTPASSFLLLLFVSDVILAGKQREFNSEWNKIQENKTETGLEHVWVVGACVLLALGCSVQLEWPCQKPGLAFGIGKGRFLPAWCFSMDWDFLWLAVLPPGLQPVPQFLLDLQPVLLQGSWKAQENVTPTQGAEGGGSGLLVQLRAPSPPPGHSHGSLYTWPGVPLASDKPGTNSML